MSADWIMRPYSAVEDESALVYLWAKSYAHSAYGRARGADKEHTDAERQYWAEQAPVIEMLLAHPDVDVEVACDPDRPRASSEGPAVIWGFAATSGDVVHYACVKRSVIRAGLGEDIMRDLLGPRLGVPCGMTHELVELRACNVRIPREWYFDSTWLGRAFVKPRPVAGAHGSVRL